MKQLAKSIPPELMKDMTPEEIEMIQYQKVMDGYEKMYESIVDSDEKMETTVLSLYDQMDRQFLDLVVQKASSGDETAEKISEIVQKAMADRMQSAADRLRVCLTAGPPDAMVQKLYDFVQAGELDDAFLLLLAGNLDQAKKAQNDNAVKILTILQRKTMELRDQQVEPEVALVRQLLRTETEDARKSILRKALAVKKKVMLSDGSQSSGTTVDGKKLVAAMRKLIEQFGNVDSTLVERVSMIGTEAEDVARELFDIEDKDIQDIQDEAFHKRSVSVFDLERMEIEAEISGSNAPWTGQSDSPPPGFDKSGRMIM
uniref:Uncharacterized protein n=1 Tax=Timspurckia oligopyrenoides TaxID=708627 RepID=A0A7S1EQS5_9RHOD